MAYQIELVVTGIDLNSDDDLEAIAETGLDEFNWSAVDDLTIVSVETDSDPVCCSIDVANRIVHQLPSVRVPRFHDDLVNISDISQRAGVNRETVRLWTTGERGPGSFPTPLGHVGGGARGSSKIWTWREVDTWLRTDLHLNLDPKRQVYIITMFCITVHVSSDVYGARSDIA